jgi:hypothetical protein
VRLATPPVACLAPVLEPPVFDAFGWCESDWLELRLPAGARPTMWDSTSVLDGSDPRGMVFVLHGRCDFLPRELARLHAFGLGLVDEEALAPWGIDDATDGFYAHRVRPRDALWLAADNLNALFWGLHDWAHFHNHGPFEQRAWTELQCDASALASETWEHVRGEAVKLSHERFAGEDMRLDEHLLTAGRLRGLC